MKIVDSCDFQIFIEVEANKYTFEKFLHESCNFGLHKA